MGEYGLGSPARSISAMADRIEEILGDQTLRARLGERGRKYVEEHHDTEVVVEALLRRVVEAQDPEVVRCAG